MNYLNVDKVKKHTQQFVPSLIWISPGAKNDRDKHILPAERCGQNDRAGYKERDRKSGKWGHDCGWMYLSNYPTRFIYWSVLPEFPL